MDGREVLPAGLKPVHYDLNLFDVDMEKLTFSGTVAIEFSVQQSVNTIYLNSRDLEIQKASVTAFFTKTESSIAVKSIDFNTTQQTVALGLESPIVESASKVLVTLDYTGIIQTNMAGFYKSQYKDNEGKSAVMLSTQFEATDARRAFPCADEPELKATFAVTLAARSDWTIIGNMPIATAKTTGNTQIVKFETTPIMSTYLLAWAIGDFEYIEGFTDRSYNGKKVPVRVYTTKGLSKQGQLALDTATKIIDYFSEIFEIDYALPKCDLLAVPEFNAGAMENWGLITYRNTALLYDEATSDSSYKATVLEVVAHELAHQWFGNLVTMSWWNELWLNEGYATYVSWLAVDHLHPEWQVFSRFVSETLQGALGLDSLRNSHPIEVPVKSALEIDQIFDNISYLKGGSVIRMISTQLTDKVFVKGVANYLKKHAYGNAKTVDLWAALSEASGIDVDAAIGTWTLKIGFPIVSVVEKDNGDVVLRQDRFLSTGDATEEENQTIWWIPLVISSGPGDEDFIAGAPSILDTKEITVPGLAKEKFFKLNKNQTGVYRVNYSAERLASIAASIDNLTLNDKIGLLADAAACCTAGIGSISGLLSVMSALKHETDYDLWSEILGRLDNIKSVWFEQPKEVIEGIQKFTQELLVFNMERLGWEFPEGEDYLQSQLRSLIIGAAVNAELPSAVEAAQGLFTKWKNDKTSIHPSLRAAAFKAALTHFTGDELKEAYDAVFQEIGNPSAVDSVELAISVIGKVQEAEYIDRGLSYILGDEIPTQEMIYLGWSLSGNPLGRWKAWAYLQANWEEIHKKYSGNMSFFSTLVKMFIRPFSSEKAYKEVETFFADKDTKGYDRIIAQCLDYIKVSTSWVQRDGPVIKGWLEDKKYM